MARSVITIAVGAGTISVSLPDREAVIPFARALRPHDEAPGPVLQEGFERLEAILRNEAGDDRPVRDLRLQVALLPPLSEARLLELPPLRSTEIEGVLRRIAPRHFPGGGRDLVVSGERFSKAGSSRPAPVFTTAADRKLVEAIQRAIESRGWKLERIVAAQACWLHALIEAVPRLMNDRPAEDRDQRGLVVAVVDDVIHLLRLNAGTPDLLRRFSSSDLDAVRAAAGPGAGSGQALALAGGETRADVVRALGEAGWLMLSPEPEEGAAGAAARHVSRARPELVSPLIAGARMRSDRRLARILIAAAAILLVTAAGVHLWGLDRSLTGVQADRRALRQMFEPALAMNDSLESMIGRIESLRALEVNATGWTAFLVELSTLLPRDTHLVSLRGEGDRVVVEAVGDRAGEALNALSQAFTFTEPRIEGLIRRELEEGMTSREHFTLSLVLTRGGDR